MKRFLTIVLGLIMALSIVCFSACSGNGDNKGLTLYAPDGAPALSIARLINDKNIIKNLDVKIIDAKEITSKVSGENPVADVCILPVNIASKVLGNANTYQMLGVVTNGNLFIMKKGAGDNVTTSNINTLVGKTVGVIQIAGVPGVTFKAILKSNNLEWTEGNQAVDSTKVNLVGLSGGTEVKPTSSCDYFVVPEPAATTKQNATSGALTIVGSLQQLYGENENGYPQAVIVAKKSVISSNYNMVKQIVNSFSDNVNWLKDENTSKETIVNAVISGFEKEMNATFSAQNLNDAVIDNCAIRFTDGILAKSSVLAYLSKINEVTNNSFGTPVDDFFIKIS